MKTNNRIEPPWPQSRRLAELAVGPHLLSPSYILINALWGGILSFTLSNDIKSDNVAAHILAVISAQALFSALLAWAYRWNQDRIKPLSPRQFVWVFVVAGALRGALLQFLLAALELSTQPNYGYRIFTGVTSVGFSAWCWALLFGIIAEWRNQSARLEKERRYLAKLQTEVETQVSTATQVEIDAFRTYLLTNLRLKEDSDISKVREQLLNVISGVIRPVVEQMLAKRTAVQLEDPEDKQPSVQLDHVIEYVTVSKSIAPPIQVLPATPSAIAAAAVLYGYPSGIAVFIAFILLWPACLYLVKFTLAPLFDHFSAPVRIFGVLFVALIAAVPLLLVLWGFQPHGVTDWAPIEFAVYAVVTGLVAAIWNAYLAELTRVYRMREQYLKHIHWKVAEVNSRRWHQQLYFARRVHGALQSEVSAVAIRIEQQLDPSNASVTTVDEISDNLQERIENVFNTHPAVANPMDVLAEIAETWDGICQVSIKLGHHDSIEIMKDPIAVDTTLEIIREGISNAIRHGSASNVWVGLALEGHDQVRVEVTNDGEPLLLTDREGMGTKYLQECSVAYSISEDRDRTHLVAYIPFRG